MKALFVPFAPSFAHMSRCLAIAEAWREQGHVAVFAVGCERITMILDAGFDAYPLPELPGAVFRTAKGFRWLTQDYIKQNLAADQGIIAGAAPDIVVFDFRFTTPLAAKKAGIPSVSILHGNAIRLATQLPAVADSLLGSAEELNGPARFRWRIMGRIFPVVFQSMMRRYARRLTPFLKQVGLPAINSPFELLLGEHTIIADIPELLPEDLPANSHMAGPLMWSGWEQTAPWLEELDERPLIYVTMGSTVEARQELLTIIHALEDAPYNVVVSIGDLSLPDDIQLPPHIRVFPTVPGTAVVKRSAAVVHHGGHGTLIQALSAGVPSFIVPFNPDQILVSQQAKSLGIAHSLWQPTGFPLGTVTLHSINPAELCAAIDHLIRDQDCALACKKIGRQIDLSASASAAARTLEDIINRASLNQEPRRRYNPGLVYQ